MMQGNNLQIRIGNGYDIHRLSSGRDLILGGIKLKHPENLGLLGHSDADVLTHSMMDALLGALSLGDIGKFFPPDDPQWKNADSLELLGEIVYLIRDKGWEIVNIDSVVIAERPKLKIHILKMKEKLSKVMQIDKDCIGIKATTNETMGFLGRKEGMVAMAVSSITRPLP